MTIVKREGLGRPMTWGELDGNFNDVESLRTEAAQAVAQSGANANASAASAGVAESARDEALEAAAQVENDLLRVIKAPEGEVLGELPVVADRNDTLLGFGSNGQPVVHPVADFVQYDGNGDIPLPVEIQSNTRELWRRTLAEAGVTLVNGSFQKRATVQNANEAVWDIDGAQCYTWSGAFPHDADGVPGVGWKHVKILRQEIEHGDGTLLGYKSPIPGSVQQSVSDVISQSICVDSFGAKGDALLFNGEKNPNRNDDSLAIQNAIIAAWKAGGAKVTFTSWRSYYISETVYILATEGTPSLTNNFPLRRLQVIDGQGARLIGKDDYTDTTNVCFESGYMSDDGTVNSVFSTNPEQYLTAGTRIENFAPQSFYQFLRGRGMVFGSAIENIMARDVPQILYTERCFYLKLSSITPSGAYIDGLHRYHLRDNNNIMPIQAVHTGVCDVGFYFDGATEALTLRECGIEGFKTYGVRTRLGYNIKFDSCYFESPQGVGCVGDNTRRITVENSWVYGGCIAFDITSDNTNMDIRRNNFIGGGSKWYVTDNIPIYNLSDIDLPTEIIAANVKMAIADARPANSVRQTKVAYDTTIGLSRVVAKLEQCSGLHTTRVNGRTGTGSSNNLTPGSIVTQEAVTDTTRRVKWETGILYSDNQLVRVAVSVGHNIGTWRWRGVVDGDTTHRHNTDDGQQITISSEGGYLVIRSPAMTSSNLGILGGEIRLI